MQNLQKNPYSETVFSYDRVNRPSTGRGERICAEAQIRAEPAEIAGEFETHHQAPAGHNKAHGGGEEGFRDTHGKSIAQLVG